jgi:hypothetical protein
MHILRPHITAQSILWAYGAQKRQGVCLLCHRSAVVVVGGLSSTMKIAAYCCISDGGKSYQSKMIRTHGATISDRTYIYPLTQQIAV